LKGDSNILIENASAKFVYLGSELAISKLAP
jgi:hypothetical protein